MIRFIDLRGQIYPGTKHHNFAFFDTIVDRFITIYDTCEWDSWESFKYDYELYFFGNQPIERFKRLCPKWAFKPCRCNLCKP